MNIVIVISSPMYNYGMPAHLKAWFDQIVRIDKTFVLEHRFDYLWTYEYLDKSLLLKK